MKISDLTHDAKVSLLSRITSLIMSVSDDDLTVLLQRIVDVLDDFDQCDFFGTEGWKHQTGDDE